MQQLQIDTNIPKIPENLINLISWRHNIEQCCKAKTFTIGLKLHNFTAYNTIQNTRTLYQCTTGSLKKNKKQKTLASEEGILLSRPLLYKLNITEDNVLTTLLTPNDLMGYLIMTSVQSSISVFPLNNALSLYLTS